VSHDWPRLDWGWRMRRWHGDAGRRVGAVRWRRESALWLGPLRPATYYAGVTLYLFTVGTCYALFTAVVLEFLGDSGKSGSGRYSIINSMGNVPVLYMIAFDGWGGSRFGPRGLSGTEAVVGGVGGAVLLAYFALRGQGPPSPESIALE